MQKGRIHLESASIYLEFVRRWYWLFALGIVASLIATNVALGDREALYRSTATIQVGRTLEERNPSQDDLAIADRLIPAYGELARRDPILRAAIETLGIERSPDQIRSALLVDVVPRTQLIDIHVLDPNPDVASAIANEIARQVVLQSPSDTVDDETQTFIKEQVADLQSKITETQTEVQELEEEIAAMTSAAEIFDAQQRLSVLNAQIETWQETYATLLAQVEPGTANFVRVVTPAVPATTPIQSSVMIYYALSLAFAVGFSALVALGLHSLDRKVKRVEDLKKLAERVPIVAIPRYHAPENAPITEVNPEAEATSAYRVLRNMVEAATSEPAYRSLVVTSSHLGEGKTTTTANLGLSLANSGHFVILVDANVRNPQLDEYFGIRPDVGFSDLLAGESVEQCIQASSHPNLWVIGAGLIPDNHPDLLATAALGPLVEQLERDADYVLFDTPAVGEEQDTPLLAQHVDGVIVVAESNRATAHDLEDTMYVLGLAGASIVAMVLNKQKTSLWTWLASHWSRDRRLKEQARRRRESRRIAGTVRSSKKREPHRIPGSAD